MPTLTPSAPFVAKPSGPNPALNGPPVFTPAPAAPADSTLAFDPNQTELRWQDNRWQLMAGTVFLKDFGRHEAEGRNVLRIVRELRLNTLTTLGFPRPIMEYWLSNGEAPRGTASGLHTVPIDPATLVAEQLQGQWCIRDGNRILFNFGQQGDVCRQGLAAIQRYGFTQIGFVGQVSPVMLVFLATPPTAPPVTPVNNPVTQVNNVVQNSNRFPDVRFPRPPGNSGQDSNSVASRQQPGAMPVVPSQPLNGPPGMPLSPPGAIAPGGFRLPGTEAADHVAIDGRQLQVRRDGNDWKLAMGNYTVANFGSSQAEAQLAQAALRHYRCTEQVFIGGPHSGFSYFLTDGQAPYGASFASNAVAFRPESLQVRQLGTSYVLHDGNQVVLSFGDRMNEAQQALQAIQKYRFDRFSTFGQGDHSMMMFMRTN
jgi:hypothetical protein